MTEAQTKGSDDRDCEAVIRSRESGEVAQWMGTACRVASLLRTRRSEAGQEKILFSPFGPHQVSADSDLRANADSWAFSPRAAHV